MDIYVELDRILEENKGYKDRLTSLVSYDKFLCWYAGKCTTMNIKYKTWDFYRVMEMLTIEYQKLIPNLWDKLLLTNIKINNKYYSFAKILTIYHASIYTIYNNTKTVLTYVKTVRCYLHDMIDTHIEKLEDIQKR